MIRTLTLVLSLFLCLVISSEVLAKKKDKDLQNTVTLTPQAQAAFARVTALNNDDKRQFDSLSDEQKKAILSGRVDIGFNEFMIKLAVGEPFYASEHHPVYVDYEQVWLYTKNEVNENKQETKIIDSQTNWPTIHRITTKKQCTVGDYFLLFDRGVVDKIVPESDKKVYGACSAQTTEAFLPIVNGQAVEPK